MFISAIPRQFDECSIPLSFPKISQHLTTKQLSPRYQVASEMNKDPIRKPTVGCAFLAFKLCFGRNHSANGNFKLYFLRLAGMQQTRIERFLTNYNSLAMKDSRDWVPGDVFSTLHVPGYRPALSMQTEFTVKTWGIADNASAS